MASVSDDGVVGDVQGDKGDAVMGGWMECKLESCPLTSSEGVATGIQLNSQTRASVIAEALYYFVRAVMEWYPSKKASAPTRPFFDPRAYLVGFIEFEQGKLPDIVQLYITFLDCRNISVIHLSVLNDHII